MPQRRSTTVTVSLVAALSLAMTGTACGSSDDDGPDYQGVCVDQRTHQRVDDDQCDDDHGHGGGHSTIVWFPRGSSVPAVGRPASGGVPAVPQGATSARGGAPKAGGVVRGGFGGKAGSVGG